MDRAHIDGLVTQEARQLLAQSGAGIVFSGIKETGGVATGEPCLVVGVPKKLPKDSLPPERRVPASVQGVPTDVVELPRPRARPRLKCHTAYELGCDRAIERHRPLVGGISVFQDRWPHWSRQSAGTLGAIVRDATDGRLVGLTNNHCMGLAYDPSFGLPWYGENDPAAVPMLQPAILDAGSLEHDLIGYGKRAVPLAFSESTSLVPPHQLLLHPEAPSNRVDGALIRLEQGIEAAPGILEIHPGPFPFATPEEVTLGLPIYKAGRTTGRVPPSLGIIFTLNATGITDYGDVYARLPGETEDAPAPVEEILAAPFERLMAFDKNESGAVTSMGGDSGSVVLGLIGGSFKIIGLFYANVHERLGLFHPIWEVASALQIEAYGSLVGPVRTGPQWFFGTQWIQGAEPAPEGVPVEATPEAGPPPPAPQAVPAGELLIPVRHRADLMQVRLDQIYPPVGEIQYGIDVFQVSAWIENNAWVHYYASLVFEGVWIPQGATLLSSHLELMAPDQGEANNTSIRMKLQYVPTGTDTRRPRSFQQWGGYIDAPVPWDYPAWVDWVVHTLPVPGTPYVSPSLNPVVQYLINRPDWTPGGGLMLTLHWDRATTVQRFYGLGPALQHDLAPRLHLVWG